MPDTTNLENELDKAADKVRSMIALEQGLASGEEIVDYWNSLTEDQQIEVLNRALR